MAVVGPMAPRTTEGPIDGTNSSQVPTLTTAQPHLALLLLHDHDCNTRCHYGHGVARSPQGDIARVAYGAYGMAETNGVGWAPSFRSAACLKCDFSVERLGDGCTGAARCQWHLRQTP